jgi:IclR family transcriptional regulator, acetate operon repressor
VCVAVRVPPAAGGARALSNLCVALQAPVMRLSIDQALQFLPALQRAAQALSRVEVPPKFSKAKR